MLPSGAMTSTRKVINSISLLCLMVLRRSHPYLLTFYFPSILGSASIHNSVWWCLKYFLHIGGAWSSLMMCPDFEQFLHGTVFLTISHRSSRDMPWNLLDGFLLFHIPRTVTLSTVAAYDQCVVVSGFHSDVMESKCWACMSRNFNNSEYGGIVWESCCTSSTSTSSFHPCSIPLRWWTACPNWNVWTVGLPLCAACNCHTSWAALCHCFAS